jgi:hypothetical protein
MTSPDFGAWKTTARESFLREIKKYHQVLINSRKSSGTSIKGAWKSKKKKKYCNLKNVRVTLSRRGYCKEQIFLNILFFI